MYISEREGRGEEGSLSIYRVGYVHVHIREGGERGGRFTINIQGGICTWTYQRGREGEGRKVHYLHTGWDMYMYIIGFQVAQSIIAFNTSKREGLCHTYLAS